LGLHDLDAAKETLQRWRSTIGTASVRADEFDGDIAREEHRYEAALSAWAKVVQSQPNNRRVKQKFAFLHQTLQHWAEADAAWGDALKLKETSTARLNRALCRRHLHRWNEAFDDYQHAQQLGPDDPAVRQWSKVFDGLQRYKEQM